MGTRVALVLLSVVVILQLTSGCGRNTGQEDAKIRQAREDMVARLEKGGAITNPRILNALRTFPREKLVPPGMADYAYGDGPVPLDNGKVLSPPTLSGLILQELNPMPRHTVLMVEVPDPSIPLLISRLCRRLVVIALLETDAAFMRETAARLGATNIEAHSCDVFQGWAAAAPYSSVLFTYDPSQIPPKIVEQLADNGTIVIFDGPYARQIRVMKVIEDEVGEPRIVYVPGATY